MILRSKEIMFNRKYIFDVIWEISSRQFKGAMQTKTELIIILFRIIINFVG